MAAVKMGFILSRLSVVPGLLKTDPSTCASFKLRSDEEEVFLFGTRGQLDYKTLDVVPLNRATAHARQC